MTSTPPFDLATYMAHTKSLVEAALDEILPAAEERPGILHQAMRYSVFSGGKRIRPILCISAWQACAGTQDFSAAIPPHLCHAASAIELLHTYTLVHDDLPCMDDDDLRRGKPTAHKAFGEANALLAGDALLTLALETTARADLELAHGHASLELASASGSQGVVGGQVEDLASIGQSVTRETVDFIHENKTAKLFRAATRIGADFAEASPEQREALSTFGEHLGIAFQILDDLIDDEQDQRSDAACPADPALSCLSVMGADEARQLAADLTLSASQALSTFDEIARQPLVAMVNHLENRTT